MARGSAVLLADGTTVHLRPIEPEDAPALVAMHSRLTERTRYLRHFSPYPRIPERDLHRFVNVDHHDREAFVVCVNEAMIAVGRYERLGRESDEAEVAFVVEDAHQGRGIGSVLLEHLAAAAAEAGITRFVAEVLPINGAMLRVFADAGYQINRQYADGVVHLTFPIAPTAESMSVQWEREQRTESRSLARLLAPRGVAVYGASRTGLGTGSAVLAHLRDGGYPGLIVPVHPEAESLAGLPAYPSAARAPGPVDLAVVAVPPEASLDVVADCAAANVHGLVVLSGGYAETGPEGAELQRRLVNAAHLGGARVIGPNCLGIANTHPAALLNATLAPKLPRAGSAGFFTQSGALGVVLLAEADRRGLGLSSFVSAGNRADVSGNDLLQYWQDDPATHLVMLYLENFGNPRKFARLVRRLGRDKPIVAVAQRLRPLPTGPVEPISAPPASVPPEPVPAETAPAAGTVSGPDLDEDDETAAPSLAGPDAVGLAALFARSGVIRVGTVSEMFDVGVLLAQQPLPAGSRVGIVTNSAALGVLAMNSCPGAYLTVAPGYPLDVGPFAGSAEVETALRRVIEDPGVDAVIAVCAPSLPGAPDMSYVEVMAQAARNGDKPLVAIYLGAELPHGVPVYQSVEEAVRALGRVAAYARWRRRPSGQLPRLADVDAAAARQAAAAGDGAALLAAYGIRAVPYRTVADADAAVAAAEDFGFPVAVKAASQSLRHRQDLGAVRTNQRDAAAVRRAYADIAAIAGGEPEVIVQPMVPPGVPCVVEMVDDPAFGPVVGFGLGGVATELIGDRAWRAAPLTDRDAATLAREPRAAPMLHGYRGSAPVDTGAIEDLLLRVGVLAAAHPEVRQIELNPVLVRSGGASVLYAGIEIGVPVPRPDTGPRQLG